MTTANRRRRADALLPLASGKTQKAVAEEVGVNPATISAWKRDRVFAAELARIKELVGRKPLDARAVLAALDVAADRLARSGPSGPVSVSGGRVTVSIPSDASPRRRRQLLARGIARALNDGGGPWT